MRTDDKKIKKALQELKIPVSYEERVDSLLKTMETEAEKKEETGKKKRGKYVFRAAVCLLCVCLMLTVTVFYSDASFFEDFKRTLMNFFGFDTEQDAENTGIDIKPVYVRGKRDMIVELKEAVMDAHNIYLLVKLTAPVDVTFAEDVGFEYFGFCEGQNYDVNYLLGGSLDCRLLETTSQRPNEANYVISKCFDEELQEGDSVTCFLENLTRDPYSDEPELLVEGIWSLTFTYERTVRESVIVEGTPDMTFPYIDGTAVVERIELTPTGIFLSLDISSVTQELMNVSDSTVAIKLLYIDGSEKIIVSHNPDESFIQGGSIFMDNQEDKPKQQQSLEFIEVLDIGEVIGFYIEDLYVPVN